VKPLAAKQQDSGNHKYDHQKPQASSNPGDETSPSTALEMKQGRPM
jgi:hypothetical protein